MYAHYLQLGHDLTKLCNLSPIEQDFYIASMNVMRNRDVGENIELAKLSNPMFLLSKSK